MIDSNVYYKYEEWLNRRNNEIDEGDKNES